jgi:hypothetical protein
MILNRVLFLLFALVVSTSSADAACDFSLSGTKLAQLWKLAYASRVLKIEMNVGTNARTYGDQCVFQFRDTYSSGIHITRSSIAKRPLRGSLEQTGKLKFRYLPPSRFKGIDRLTIRICGYQTGKEQLCMPMAIAVEVRCAGPAECGERSLCDPSDKSTVCGRL